MPTLSKVAALHGALWNVDPWYRRSWYVGPLSTALMICGWIVAQPQQPEKSLAIPWAVPLFTWRPAPAVGARPTNYGQGTLPPAAAAPRKAVLYEDDATEPSEGTVNWRSDETGADDRPKEFAIKAEIEVPGRKIKMTLTIRRNTDASLPASHLAELSVTLPPDFAGGGITGVKEILLKQNHQDKGNPLAAIAVKVHDGLFMIGLSNTDPERALNMYRLENGAWIEIVLVCNNQRRVTIALEKGEAGQRVVREAIVTWLRQ
jgi:hypothetical protein